MAGRPRERQMVLELERRTREWFEDNDHTVLDFVCAWQAAGNTLVRLAREMSERLGLDIGGERITYWMYRAFDRAEVVARLAEARETGAYALVDQAQQDAIDLTDKDDAPVVRTKNDTRFWIATRFNRRELGEQKAGVNINLNVGSLHLDAMRVKSLEVGKEQASSASAHARSLPGIPDIEVPTIPGSQGQSATVEAIVVEHEVLSDESVST